MFITCNIHSYFAHFVPVFRNAYATPLANFSFISLQMADIGVPNTGVDFSITNFRPQIMHILLF